MQAALDHYFKLEFAESWVFLAFGVATLLWAGFALARRTPEGRGLALALAAVAVIQLTVGATIALRTGGQVQALSALLAAQPEAFAAAEQARMAAVMASFRLYLLVELGFIVIGAGLLWRAPRPGFWRGLGLGMLVQGALMLPADFLAMDRGADYLAAIAAMRPQR